MMQQYKQKQTRKQAYKQRFARAMIYEIAWPKITASMLPSIAKLFAIPLEQLMGVEKQPVKRGPASVLQRQIEQIGLIPRNKQKFIAEMLGAMIKQQQAS